MGGLKGEITYPEGLGRDAIMKYLSDLNLFGGETLSRACKDFNTWKGCFSIIKHSEKSAVEILTSVLYLCALGTEQISEGSKNTPGLRSIILPCLKKLSDRRYTCRMTPEQKQLLNTMLYVWGPYEHKPTKTRSCQDFRIHMHTGPKAHLHRARTGTWHVALKK